MYAHWQSAADAVRDIEQYGGKDGNDERAISALDQFANIIMLDPEGPGSDEYAIEFVALYQRLRATDI